MTTHHHHHHHERLDTMSDPTRDADRWGVPLPHATLYPARAAALEILDDFSVSYTTRAAIRHGLQADPIDAASDANLVARVLGAVANEVTAAVHPPDAASVQHYDYVAQRWVTS